MKLSIAYLSILLLTFNSISCYAQKKQNKKFTEEKKSSPIAIQTGAEQTEEYLPLLKDRKVALVINQTSVIGNRLLLDSLLKLKINIVKIFSPEHGFRGESDAGEKINNQLDNQTGLPVISLYGNNKKPKLEDLKGIDIVLFDIQDVGARFYTYISTMTYLMESCAENQIDFLLLDRPNPNGFYIDGPLLQKEFSSFVGLHSVPVVYGMTIAEYARMVNGEKWLNGSLRCNLTTIPCKGYSHSSFYQLPVKPSPNLPNMRSIYLYPSLCFFEGTVVSVGRGTDWQFQVIGFPEYEKGDFLFTPVSKPGAQSPPYLNKICKGYDLSILSEKDLQQTRHISLKWLIEMYRNSPDKNNFFNIFFVKLTGNSELKKQIIDGWDEEKIRSGWQSDIDAFKKIRKKYLLYEDFE